MQKHFVFNRKFGACRCTLNGEQTHEKILEKLRDGILIYSSQSPDEMKKTQALAQERVESSIESELSKLAADSIRHGYTKIISAGGETSGGFGQKDFFECAVNLTKE